MTLALLRCGIGFFRLRPFVWQPQRAALIISLRPWLLAGTLGPHHAWSSA